MREFLSRRDQAWLIDSVFELVRRNGYEPLVCNPIVTPDATHFPESRGKSEYMIDRVTRRLLQYAGLGDLGVEFCTYAATLKNG